ncbi:KUP/HAK/KT family potassium transporter [Coxiella burnetii]|uniref:KUP/HAK/KT family potassium transporter n=1 Tax=Coxiella burnetii TaxID=777 RepID=UPI001F5B68AA|nr:KUP/HAK/KT family potassium transporter [Coxiella burnetii]
MTNGSSLQKQAFFSLALGALGVVYGDIGTSPLCAIRESLDGLPINLIDVLGVLSLIFWALITVISIKYLWIVLRADNHGEGGILALLALLKRTVSNNTLFCFSICRHTKGRSYFWADYFCMVLYVSRFGHYTDYSKPHCT